HKRLQSIQAQNVQFKCSVCVGGRARYLLAFKHLSVVFALDLRQDLNLSLLQNLIGLHLVTAIISRRWK
ncbi:MAG: hypothetical protein ACK559_05520, partial [bacterium]